MCAIYRLVFLYSMDHETTFQAYLWVMKQNLRSISESLHGRKMLNTWKAQVLDN